MRRLGALLLGVLALCVVFAAPAYAHASLVSADPADGSRLESAPAAVTLRFDEPVGLGASAYVQVADQTGARVEEGAATHPDGDGAAVRVRLRAGLGDGLYTVTYRVISADSHPAAGAVRFAVGDVAFPPLPSTPENQNDSALEIAFALARWLALGGLALLGGGWLLVSVWPAGRADDRGRRLVWAGWGLVVLGTIASLVLQGPYIAGTGLGDVADWGLLDGTLHTSFGTLHAARLVLLGLLAVVIGAALRAESRLDDTAGPLFAAVAVTFSAAGHANAQHPRWLAVLSDATHLCAMAVWIGGLVMLTAAVLPRRDDAELRAVLPVFSKVAAGSVALLALTGTFQAWRGIGEVDALTGTTYGRLVLLKVFLFAGILLLGNLSRTAIARSYGRGTDLPDADARRMSRSVAAEVGLAAVVLLATAFLVAKPPGKAALAATDSRPRSAAVDFGNGRGAILTVTPGRAGQVSVTVDLDDDVQSQSVTATATHQQQRIGPLSIPLSAGPGGTYTGAGVVLPSAGPWVFAVTLRTSEFDSVVAEARITLK